MSTIAITKDEAGKLVGVTEADKKAYARFRKMVNDLEQGEVYHLEHWFPRNKKLHGLHFVMIGKVFDRQEQFEDPEELRKWLYVGAGFCNFYPGPSGRMVAIPKSINWKSIDDEEMSKVHNDVIAFLRSPRATGFLWGHLSEHDQSEMVEQILGEFDGN